MKIKICGVIHPDDAAHAAKHGADFIGIIFSPKSKRMVSLEMAKEIAAAARKEGAQTVGVFVDETAEEIISHCLAAKIDLIQLHGPAARKALLELPGPIIFALAAGEENPTSPDYLLIEGKERGVPFDWIAFSPPTDKLWFLAGGLTPDNVAEAIAILKPYGVDVSSGIENGYLRKDPHLVEQFIRQARL